MVKRFYTSLNQHNFFKKLRNNDIIWMILYKILVILCVTTAYDMVFLSNAMSGGFLQAGVKPLLRKGECTTFCCPRIDI